ncbi:Ger(x)C family spore germination protein [Paenisporosarcina quisquiliarum]|uniref:Ger(x)C family spore germination protein n=1 Tax=Paenisporosarcina quisquiliarum TaxID=365346 RepID=UPI0037368DFF
MTASRFIMAISILLVLNGCTTKQGTQPSLERLGMISVAGFDYIDNDNMRLTVIMPQPALEAEKHTQVITVDTDMLHKGLVDISSRADKTVSLKQLRVVLFSEEFARKGQMKEMVEYLFKDADVRSSVFVGVVKESAEEMLRMEYPDKQNTSSYINNLFHPRQYTFFSPFTTIHEFVYDETDPLRDTIAPYVELKDDVIHIEGLAMFSNGKMETIFTKQEAKIIQILRGREKLSVFALTLDDEEKEKVALEFVKSKAKVKTENLESPKVIMDLKFEGTLSEYEGDKDLANKKHVETLEKEVSKNIENDIRSLLEKCQELSIEPIGMFETLRMRYKGDWPTGLTEELLAKAQFEITVETKLTSVGALK